MQHYKMPRDIQIAVIDGKRRFGNKLCLPAGPLREPIKRLKNCDFIVINGSKNTTEIDKDKAREKWTCMSVNGSEIMNLQTEKTQNLSHLSAQKVNAVTGIGNPQRFYSTLEKAGLKLTKHSFPDHHQFQPQDLEFDNDLPIIMTEKDAVKCQQFAAKNCWYLPVKAELPKDFDQCFLAEFKALMAKNVKKGGDGS